MSRVKKQKEEWILLYLDSGWRTSCTWPHWGTRWRWGPVGGWQRGRAGWTGPVRRCGKARGVSPLYTDLSLCYWGRCTSHSPAGPDTDHMFCTRSSSPLQQHTQHSSSLKTKKTHTDTVWFTTTINTVISRQQHCSMSNDWSRYVTGY